MTDLQEGLTSLPNLLTSVFVNILLADMGTPLGNDLLLQNVNLVEAHQHLGHEWNEIRMGEAKETFDTAKQRFLVFLRCNKLRETNQDPRNDDGLQGQRELTLVNKGP